MAELKGASLILPYLYLGGESAASDKEALQAAGVEVIVNCSNEIENEFPDDFTYMELDLEDTHNCNIKGHFDNVYEILKTVKEEKQKALVHCTSGKSMAPAIVASYMLNASAKADKHLPLKKALDFIHSKRPGSCPNDNFTKQLIELEVELYDDASMRVATGKKSSGHRRGKGKRGK